MDSAQSVQAGGAGAPAAAPMESELSPPRSVRGREEQHSANPAPHQRQRSAVDSATVIDDERAPPGRRIPAGQVPPRRERAQRRPGLPARFQST